ncbi:MAG: hypothetical protein KY476_10460 [Planctomycetes bacterium]|nr:hypothetical protein [Planctomycetota bacterium]
MNDSSHLPWVECPTLRFDASLPCGERYQHVPRDVVRRASELLAAVWRDIPPEARRLANLVRVRTLGRFQAEVTALAAMIGADWRDVMVANVCYDLVLSSIGCSTVALATADGPVLARNMDWWPEDVLARASYLLKTERDGRLVYANAGWPGAVGVVSGLSGRGFGIVLNAVLSPEGLNRLGYPVLLHLRRVLEDAGGFDDALKRLEQTKLAAPGLFTLVGTENHQRAVIERSPRRAAVRRAIGDEPLAATNHYRALAAPERIGPPELVETTCQRYDALCRFFADVTASDSVSDERLLYALSDPSIIQPITAQHIILRPRLGEIRLFVPRKFVRG